MASDDNRISDEVIPILNGRTVEEFARDFTASLDEDTRDWLVHLPEDTRRRVIEGCVRIGVDLATGGSVDIDDLAALATPQPPSLRRPAVSASRAKWVDYVVGLGADRDRVGGRTKHYGVVPHSSGVPGLLEQGYAALPALTKDELIDLADRLGG